MPRDEDVPEIAQIFLSATAEDCRSYRQAVRDNLQAQFRAARIFLQEQWAEGGQLTLEVCKQRVLTSDAYIGLFGYRYGWEPPGYTVSITELEFRWALERWPRAPAPMFVMLPREPSAAQRQLRAKADKLLKREFPQPDRRAAAERRRDEFVARVREWADRQQVIVEFFDSQRDLERKTAASVGNWNLDVLRQALRGRRAAPGNIPADELGRIGRRDQREKLAQALEAFADRRDERCVAFVVHGPEGHGQSQFAEYLARRGEWDGMDVRDGLAPQPDSAASLAGWLCSQLGEPVPGGAGIDGLATLLAARLAQRSVVVVLRSLGEQPGRLAAFQAGFWVPLRDALAQRRPAGAGRLYCFVIEHEALPPDPGAALAAGPLDDPGQDYARLLALPRLTPITRAQVRGWLTEIGDPKNGAGIVLDEARRDAIAERAVAGGGNPPIVYDRLAREGFWAA